MAITKITKAKAEEMIAEIDKAVAGGPPCVLSLIQLGKFYYDTTNVPEQEIADFISEHNRRKINRPEFGATRI